MRSKLLRLLVIGSLMGVMAACGDDTDTTPDSSVRADGGTTDAGNDPDAFVPEVDGGSDAGSDAGTDGGPPAPSDPIVVALSTTGHDRLFGVTHDAAGNIYATGQMAASTAADADHSLIVAKFSPAGVLDTTFGDDGVASVNVAVGGRALEVARGIVVQSTGRIVIAGTAETDPTIGEAGDVRRFDTDIVLVGFTAAGVVDATFGDEGVTRIEELNDGVVTQDMSGNDVLTGADTQWSLALASEDRLVVHGTTRASGEVSPGMPRTDADWALLRLTADGELDDTFSGDGIVTLDLSGAGATARSASVLPDGSIIGSGYLTSALLVTAPVTSTQQPVIYKVTPAGEFDATFATADATTAPGVWHDLAVPQTLRAEAYGAALQGDRLVTMGYGPTPTEGGMGTDWISLRYTSDGELDTTYGTSGITYIDVSGLGDNGRAVLVLPDDRVMGVGGGRPMPAAGAEAEVDAMVAILTPDGLPDTEFADDGFRLYDLAGSDFFWGASLAEDGSSVAIVGVAGAVTAATDDDDSILFVLPVD